MPTLLSDEFTGADGTTLPAYDSVWSRPAWAAYDHIISGNRAAHTTNAGDHINIATGISWPNDQWAQAVFKNLTSEAEAIVIRHKLDGTVNFYGGGQLAAAGWTTYTIYKWVAGVLTRIGFHASESPGIDETIYFDAQGSNLILRANGTSKATVTGDTSHASGAVGITSSNGGAASGLFDSFVAGDFSVGGGGGSPLLTRVIESGFRG